MNQLPRRLARLIYGPSLSTPNQFRTTHAQELHILAAEFEAVHRQMPQHLSHAWANAWANTLAFAPAS